MSHLAAAAAVAKTAAGVCSTLPAKTTASHSIFNPIAKPIADVLAAFYSVIPDFGVAIILLSVVWMLIIAPLTLKSTRSMLAMQKLQPQLKKLQAEHRDDRQAFAQAQMDLYREHNVSPFGSCLPSILPLPVFFALFRVIDGLSHKVTYHGVTCAVPSFLDSHTAMYKSIVAAGGKIEAFGLDLSKNALSGHSSVLAALPFYILLLIMIGTQYLQTVQMMNRNPAAQDNPQMKMMKYLPIIFGVICIRFPAGVILYYAVSNICRMTQQTLMYRFDPKVKTLVNQEVIEVESNTKRIDKGGKSAPATPAPRTRFRDLLNQAQEQARADREKRDGGGGSVTAPKGQPTPGRNTAKKANPPAKKANPATKKATPTAKKATPQKANPPAKKQGSPPAKKPAPPADTPTGTTNGATNGDSAGTDGGTKPPPSQPSGRTGGRTGGGRTGGQGPRGRKRQGN